MHAGQRSQSWICKGKSSRSPKHSTKLRKRIRWRVGNSSIISSKRCLTSGMTLSTSKTIWGKHALSILKKSSCKTYKKDRWEWDSKCARLEHYKSRLLITKKRQTLVEALNPKLLSYTKNSNKNTRLSHALRPIRINSWMFKTSTKCPTTQVMIQLKRNNRLRSET